MRAHVLGTLRLDRGQDEVPAPSGQVGNLLRFLLQRPNETHPTARLLDLLWPDAVEGDGARRRLQVTVSRLRAFLRPETADEAGSLEVAHEEAGYQLVATADSLDRVAFEALAAEALEQLDPELVPRALDLWHGDPYFGFPLTSDVRVQHARLVDLRRRLADLHAGSLDPREWLLRAKLRPPTVVGEVIERSALLRRVPGVGGVPVLSVTAPAGFGKSTFLDQWASHQAAPVAWLALDDGDNDPARFWSGLMRSLTEAVGDDLATRAGDARAGSTAFLDAFGELVDPHRRGIGLVLDDLHLVTNERVLSDVERLIAVLPDTCTIALSSRVDPPIASARLEAEGRLHTVTATDLRFSTADVQGATGCDEERAQHLWEVSEGWPVAVTALQRSGATLPARASSVIGEYVADEVFDVLPPDVLSLVLEVAHLDSFNVDLCEAATGRTDVREGLGWLREQGLFLVDLGRTKGDGWCRVHHLIASVARTRGGFTVDTTSLWRRAARWCRDNGLTEDALRYAVQARDRATVAATAGGVLLDSAVRGEAHTCLRWLGAIDPDDLRDDPRGHGVGVYMATEWMSRDDRGPWLRSRRRHFGGDDDVVLRLVEAIEAMREGRSTEAVELSQRVMDESGDYAAAHAPDLATLLLGSAFSNQIRARLFQGTASHDDPLFPSAIALLRPHVPILAAFVHSYWGLVALVEGEEALAESLAEEYYETRRPRELSRPVRRDNSMLGALLASRHTTDPGRLSALAAGIEDVPALFEDKGQHTDAAMAQLALASLHGRAGNREQHRHHERRAAVLMRTFDDAPFVTRMRDALLAIDDRAEDTPGALAERLTPRQRTIVAFLATDLSTKDIAEELHISVHTLRTHLRDVYRRLGVRSRHQAVMKLAVEPGDLDGARAAAR